MIVPEFPPLVPKPTLSVTWRWFARVQTAEWAHSLSLRDPTDDPQTRS